MAISDRVKLIGIGSDEEKKRIKIGLSRLKMKNIVVVNLHYLNNYSRFPKIYPLLKKIMEERKYFKILFSDREGDIKNLPSSNGWQNRTDISYYTGEKLEFDKSIIRSYLHWVANNISLSS